MRSHLKHILILVVCCIAFTQNVIASTEIGDLITKIREADKVEHLYTVRYNLNILREKNELSLNDKRELLQAYSLLTDAFKQRNHFRNADIVYLDYLTILDEFHKEYSTFLSDSVQKSNMSELGTLKNKSTSLDEEVTVLKQKQAVISGMKSSYYTFSLIATILILVVFAVIFFRKNSSISEARATIAMHRSKISSLFKNQVEASIAEGSVSYAKYAAQNNISYIEELNGYFDLEKDRKVNHDAIEALRNYSKLMAEASVK